MESRSKLDVIQSRLEAPLADMNGVISESMHTGNELLNRVVTDYLRIKGKQIRPIMVLLSVADSRRCGGRDTAAPWPIHGKCLMG